MCCFGVLAVEEENKRELCMDLFDTRGNDSHILLPIFECEILLVFHYSVVEDWIGSKRCLSLLSA